MTIDDKELYDLGIQYEELHDYINSYEDYDGGCKSGCNTWSYGFERERGSDSYFFTFGGYCLPNMSRHEIVTAETRSELIDKVKTLLNTARKEEDIWRAEVEEKNQMGID